MNLPNRFNLFSSIEFCLAKVEITKSKDIYITTEYNFLKVIKFPMLDLFKNNYLVV